MANPALSPEQGKRDAYAVASGLAGVYGLYATIVPLLVYALFGPRRILALGGKRFASLMPLFLVACAAPPTWQKPGVDNATLAKDTSDCQADAERESMRRYPYGFNYAPAASGTIVAMQRDETNRSIVETSVFKACMEGRGYTRS